MMIDIPQPNWSTRTLLASILCIAVFCSCGDQSKPTLEYVEMSNEDALDLAEKVTSDLSLELIEGTKIALWAVDSLVKAPIAISIDPNGHIYYTSATRQSNSEFDIRGYREWMTASISWQSVEDRRKFLRETLSADKSDENTFLTDLNGDGIVDWTDLTVEKEQVWRVMDSDGDGIADRSEKYLEDFHEEVTDVANGVLVHEDNVFVAVGPDLWRTQDRNNDGMADFTESISHGYAVHIGFGAHGMSGLRIGPYGRVWWGIGDIGMNVVDKDGKRWKYPNQGVIVRSDLDGSGFEVFAAGLRNTHEFIFDKYGNLITEDNDGDHPGERERLVYVTNGSDGGWRTNWQFGKYTDPTNNDYKVWMDERLHVPRWEGQAAYITPPIINYVNGPTGLIYNPGTALNEQWYDHFFVAEFTGTPARSPIHAFTLRPNGASFELAETKVLVKGTLPTGLGFGPDGALYFADWLDGWEPMPNGRIWKLDVTTGTDSPIRLETKKLIQENFKDKTNDELYTILSHQDMRVRMKSQFELVKREQEGFEVLERSAKSNDNQLGRVHGIWGIAQMSRKNMDYAASLSPLLVDDDEEIAAQAAKAIGDVRYTGSEQVLIGLLAHPSPRVRFFAAEALGRTESGNAVEPILRMLDRNQDEDAWLRHAGIMALARIGNADQLVAMAQNGSRSRKIAAVVALRRMGDSGISVFLNDEDEYIVTEAARAINDDYSIPDAIPALAQLLASTSFTSEPLIRRAINANLRVGTRDNLQILIDYASKQINPSDMRVEALATLGSWANPSVMDRVDGRYRGPLDRNPQEAVEIASSYINDLLNDGDPGVVAQTAKVIGLLQLSDSKSNLVDLLNGSRNAGTRLAALNALTELNDSDLLQHIETGLQDESSEVRSAALTHIVNAGTISDETIGLFESVLESGSITEQQVALTAIGKAGGEKAEGLLTKSLESLNNGALADELGLDLDEAIRTHGSEALMEGLNSHYNNKYPDDPLAEYRYALSGGNANKGRRIFFAHEGAQCMRCHTVWEWGGDAGPSLAGVADRLSREQMLESLIEPSATISPGFGVVSIDMANGDSHSGILVDEDDSQITLRMGDQSEQSFQVENITERINAVSSMPSVRNVLTKHEVRDLIEALSQVKGDPPSFD